MQLLPALDRGRIAGRLLRFGNGWRDTEERRDRHGHGAKENHRHKLLQKFADTQNASGMSFAPDGHA